ncbi:LruC domain-containing protein [Pedobacter sp. CG_S7]|uniref:LruC domain-containing protein n=1 Tax=Pedobacter sp. CG_S7 TaxID=3143930 RepID=UPI00339239F9
MKKLQVLYFLLAIFFMGCKKNTVNTTDNESLLIGDKKAPDGFNYTNTKKVDINVRLLSRNDKPVPGVLVSIFDPSNLEAGAELTKVISDANGYIKTSINIPASLDTLTIDPAYIGLISNAKAYISNNSITAILGGSTGSAGNIVAQASIATSISSIKRTASSKTLSSISGVGSTTSTVYVYNKSNYDAYGRPLALEAVDNFDFVALMQQMNIALPERKVVNPKFIHTEAPANLSITSLADVWITFMHEGADYRNTLAYYTYPTGKAPVNTAEIDSIHLIFPNASLKNGRGEGTMLNGDKIKIGRFKAGISIGFVLLQNAYKSDGTIKTDGEKFYTNENLNPEGTSLKRHTVLLHDDNYKIFLVGFEDINRTPGSGSDQDFNDVVFYAQSNPVEAISPIGIPYLESKVIDTDLDGVPDWQDKYPFDKLRAYNRYYPSENVWGTIAFEDMWPVEGDYDLNDLVVSYRYKFAMNSANKVVDLTGVYKPIAAGASFQNGFGVQLPLSYSEIDKVTGYNLSGNSYIKLAANGLEVGQDNPVFIAFDNYKNLFGGTNSYINTIPGSVKLNGTQVTVAMLFTSPLSDDFTAKAPFNPFMISNLNRKKEVHLVNHKPTTLADLSLLSTGADNSNPNKNRYYLTAQNRPFAMDIFGEFLYPIEKKPIYEVYFNFAAWALSGGKVYTNWYSNTKDRNNNAIYK